MRFLGRVFLVTVISALVAFAVIVMAPYISPGVSSDFLCPMGTHIDPEHEILSWTLPFNIELSAQCKDSAGVIHTDLVRSKNGFWQLFLIFFFIMMVISSLLYLSVFLLVPKKEDPKKKRRYSQY